MGKSYGLEKDGTQENKRTKHSEMKNNNNRSGGRGGNNSGSGKGDGNSNSGNKTSRKESILELAKLVDSSVLVKCNGGRELRGTLRGFDELVNLVLDDCDEFLRDSQDSNRVTENVRKLGLVVIRGTQVSLVCPDAGTEEIANPFLAGQDEQEDGDD